MKKTIIPVKSKIIDLFGILGVLIYSSISGLNLLYAQTAMINVSARHCTSLNGKWQAIIDPTGAGDWRQVWQERKPEKKTDFIEYSFEGGPLFNVPGDFNSQMTELKYFEGTVWYKKSFNYDLNNSKRLFLHFGAVNYCASVYLNGNFLGKHEGGFTPFQFEITGAVKRGGNIIVVRVNNQRLTDGIPGLGYDWFNYGGITRDVNLVETDNTYISDYFIQLKKHSSGEVLGWVKLNGDHFMQKVEIVIPELKVDYKTKSNNEGLAEINFVSRFDLWSPENPKLYRVIVRSETDTVTDNIGFRSIEVKGSKIILNGKMVFLKGINIHEENPFRAARAYSEPDALILLTWAKELGCNMVRLAHYPHNEYMIRLAEKMGIMIWDEIPVYQQIEFSAPGVRDKMDLMMREMVRRDKNRCGVIVWSLSNETSPSVARDIALINITDKCRHLDSTRLITSVINDQNYQNNILSVWDTLYRHFDIISLNEYLGWYVPWQGRPQDVKWKMVCRDKPVVISEFGGEALYGNNIGPKDEAASWSEDYQEQIYKDQTEMLKTVPDLSGIFPWLLVDYRSSGRMHPVYQNGWNRKGLISDRGDKKKAWYILKAYYDNIKNNY
ncbi:MAG: glycoside hydrolase family 2 TIM barrel-domain containing protein [Bacteroidales bacterium]